MRAVIVLGASLLIAVACVRAPAAVRLVPYDTPPRITLVAPDDLTGVFTRLGKRRIEERTQLFHLALRERTPARPLVRAEDPAAAASALRDELRALIFDSGVAPRWRDHTPAAPRTSLVATQPGYTVHTFQFDPMPDVWVPGVLYVPDGADANAPAPAMLMLSGHSDSTYMEDIQRRAINFAKRGFVVLQLEWFGRGQLALTSNGHDRLAQLELCGTHALAPFLLTLVRAVDVLTRDERVDASTIGVAGLSGGGWQTLWLSALDERVAFANPVAGFCAYAQRATLPQAMGDHEQTPTDLYLHADYTDLVRLIAPRPVLLTYNERDEYFPADPCLEQLEGDARPHFTHLGADAALRAYVSDDPGTHVMETQARHALHRFVDDVTGALDGDTDDLDVDDELLSLQALRENLPSPRRTLHGLSLEACEGLPRDAALPVAADLARWQADKRDTLAAVLRLAQDGTPVTTLRAFGEGPRGERIEQRDIEHAGLTAPFVFVAPRGADRVVLVLDDAGRAWSAERAVAIVEEQGAGAATMDPLHIGTSQVEGREWLYALMVSATGSRSLGVQAAQVLAAARAIEERTDLRVHLEAKGMRSSVIALVAAALAPDVIESVTLREALVSLRNLVDNDISQRDYPELFTFGLLEHFELAHLVALAAPAIITVADDDGRFAEAWGAALALGR